ncbi:hypothetical protein GYB57_04650 [bacterium]|nr:hypothetical protein [bacterium]
MSQFKIKDNYQTYMSKFKSDTGLDAKENPALYIEYYKAASLNSITQMLNDISQQIERLPDNTSLRFGEMLKNSHSIKELLRKF